MDIIVEGKAKRFFKPDKVCININFYTLTKTYNEALDKGTTDVEIFVKDVFEKLGFNKEELKTRSFNVREETDYNVDTKKYEFSGFSYSQAAKFSFDYDIKRLSEFMEAVSKLNNPPRYQISFDIKNMEQAKSLVMADAYAKAEEKAKMIALAAGKKLKECIKVDFRPFEEYVTSNSRMGGDVYEREMFKQANVSERIQNTFAPEDVEVTETLYCLWVTE